MEYDTLGNAYNKQSYIPYELQFGRKPNYIFSEENEKLTLQNQNW